MDDPSAVPRISDLLRRYAEALQPWSAATAGRMIGEVNEQDEVAWRRLSKELNAGIRHELLNTPTGELTRALLDEQVTLIKSIPLEAAQRLHDLNLKRLEDSRRASEIVSEIMRSGEVAAGRARTIARTETSRVASTFTQARAQQVGSTGYIWRTAHDTDVRHSHREMNGKFVPWDQPPTLDGLTGHAGCLPNCRCYPEPVIPDD